MGRLLPGMGGLDTESFETLLKRMPRPKLKVSVFSLAREFGVSAPTISKALSNSSEVSDDLRRRVRERADQLGFRPTRPRRTTYNICVLLDMEFRTDFRMSGYEEAVVEGVYAFCDEKEVEFSLYAQTSDKLESMNLVREMHLRNADCAVVIGASSERNYFKNFEENRFPFCCIFDGPEDRVVKVDNFAAGKLAFDHLYRLGHRKVAVARQSARRAASRDRFLSFIRRAGESDIAEDVVIELIPDSPFSAFDWGRSLLNSWREQNGPWTAVFCLSENIALGILSEAAIQGIRIPEDLAVLGCDDLISCQRSAPPLSVVDIPNKEAGYEAAMQVWKAVATHADDKAPPANQLLPVERVIARHSTTKPGRLAPKKKRRGRT